MKAPFFFWGGWKANLKHCSFFRTGYRESAAWTRSSSSASTVRVGFSFKELH
ncbi:hypothetical protein AmDm5_0708 [Acetobacter malorum]|nr:hypothetical protein AmDm5_0708 [Acetobacter malorum]